MESDHVSPGSIQEWQSAHSADIEESEPESPKLQEQFPEQEPLIEPIKPEYATALTAQATRYAMIISGTQENPIARDGYVTALEWQEFPIQKTKRYAGDCYEKILIGNRARFINTETEIGKEEAWTAEVRLHQPIDIQKRRRNSYS